MAKFLFIACLILFPIGYLYSQDKDQDLPLVQNLTAQFGYKIPVVCLHSTTVINFDTAGSVAKATLESNQKFISLKDEYKFTDVMGCNEYVNVSDIEAYDNKDNPVFTNIIDQSNESGEDFYSDERIRAFQVYFPAAGNKRNCEEQTIITDLKYLTQVYFVNSYPILTDSIIVRVPEWLKLDIKEMNFDSYDIQKDVREDPARHLTIYTYCIKNMPRAYFNEENVPGASYMFPHILIMCKNYTRSNGQTVNILNSFDDIYQWYEKLIKETGNNSASLEPLVNKIIQGKTTNIDKAKAIYYWVEDNIRYLAFENGIVGYKPAPCQTVINNKYGDCKCMANLLTEMLKLAGLDARRAWLGTKEIAYDMSTPSLADHNHAICVLLLDGKHYYLDATAGYASLGYDNDMIQGRDILLENGNTFSTEKIPVASIETNKTEINKTLSLNGDLITGNAQYTYKGDSKTSLLYNYNHLPGTEKDMDMKHFIEHYDPNINLSAINISDLQNLDQPISINYAFSIKNQVTKFDKDVYISIDYDKKLQNMEFDSARHCDYEFDFRMNCDVSDTLIIPVGYVVKHVPDDLNITTPDYSFIVKVSRTADKIIYHKEIKIPNEIIRKKNFGQWNAAIKQLKNIYDDQVILSQS